ncbi:unnamed protein product [Moneuplotes crassus]|uniref:Uncharacterized protein n=1 Tax=Euplotes crassus TaxID=5936 RepID=A0AAD1XBI0_EUPCR|nr:unnamed protein product [Moneuplotes crassus]
MKWISLIFPHFLKVARLIFPSLNLLGGINLSFLLKELLHSCVTSPRKDRSESGCSFQDFSSILLDSFWVNEVPSITSFSLVSSALGRFSPESSAVMKSLLNLMLHLYVFILQEDSIIFAAETVYLADLKYFLSFSALFYYISKDPP